MFNKILSLLFMFLLTVSSALGIPFDGLEGSSLFTDADFSDGFTVLSQQTENGNAVALGEFTYGETENAPAWMIAQWNAGDCLWNDRITSDEYTLTDGTSKWVTYNKDENSVALRLNATAVYNGQPADYDAWPHLLLEQSPLADYAALSDEEKAVYNLADNRFVLDLKLRLADFKDTTNPDGVNAVQFLTYFYLKDTDGHNFIWFGADLFDNRGHNDTYWAVDSASGNMIYTLSTKDTYGTLRTLLSGTQPVLTDEWTTVRVDLTPHLADVIARANEDNIFGEEVSLADFYIGGTNIGFEIHGNYDCTVEIKDFNLTSYRK